MHSIKSKHAWYWLRNFVKLALLENFTGQIDAELKREFSCNKCFLNDFGLFLLMGFDVSLLLLMLELFETKSYSVNPLRRVRVLGKASPLLINPSNQHCYNKRENRFSISFIRAQNKWGENKAPCYYTIMHLLKYDTRVWRFDWGCYNITPSFLV